MYSVDEGGLSGFLGTWWTLQMTKHLRKWRCELGATSERGGMAVESGKWPELEWVNPKVCMVWCCRDPLASPSVALYSGVEKRRPVHLNRNGGPPHWRSWAELPQGLTWVVARGSSAQKKNL